MTAAPLARLSMSTEAVAPLHDVQSRNAVRDGAAALRPARTCHFK